jgi:hypothetical protein
MRGATIGGSSCTSARISRTRTRCSRPSEARSASIAFPS